MSKRYIGFYGSIYYPSGGAEDVLIASNYIEEVEATIEMQPFDSLHSPCRPWKYDWAHILDTETMEIVKEYEEDYE